MPEHQSEAVNFAREFLNTDIPLDDIRAKGFDESHAKERGEALRRAAVDPDPLEFDVLTGIAADLLRKGELLPVWLAAFTADVLEGKRKRPTRRGPDKLKNWARDYSLWRAVGEVAERFNLPKYTNNELSEKTTAADIVSEASGCGLAVVTNACQKIKTGVE